MADSKFIGSRDHLEETPVFHTQNYGRPVDVPLNYAPLDVPEAARGSGLRAFSNTI